MNCSGAILWSKKIISGLSVDRMEITPDKRLLLAGTVQQDGVLSDGVKVSNPDEFDSVFLLFYDLEGNHTKTHLIPEYAFFHDLKFNQGELFLLGWMKGVNQPVIDWITKYDGEYQVVWSKPLFSCSSELYNLDFSPEMQLTENGTILIAGGFMNEYVCFSDQILNNIPIPSSYPFTQTSCTFLMELDDSGEPLGILLKGEDLRNQNLRLVKGTDGNMFMIGIFQSSKLNFGEYDAVNPCPLDTLLFPSHGIEYLYRSYYSYLTRFRGRVISDTSQNQKDYSILLYPNPTNNTLYLQSESFTGQPVQVQIFSADGRLVRQQNISGAMQTIQIQTGDLPPGMYIATTIVNQQISSARFVKQ